MAGMLPGVECARRRRFHQSGGSSESPSMAGHGLSRRPSFCLYASNRDHTHHHAPSTVSSLRSIMSQAYQDEKLGGAAREARERLDERLGTQRKSSETKRQLSGGNESLRCVNGRPGSREMHTQVLGASKSCSSRSGSKRFSWKKLTWKALEQEDCAICLERFKMDERLVNLPCAHRFHGRCLVPWLEANAHCPCCRLEILPPPSLLQAPN